MIILTVAALAAAQPAAAPPAQAGTPVQHGARHEGHGQNPQRGDNCPCCDHQSGSGQDRDCCAEHARHRGHDTNRR